MAKKAAKKADKATKKAGIGKMKKAKVKSSAASKKTEAAVASVGKRSAKKKKATKTSARRAPAEKAAPRHLTKSPLTKTQLKQFREMLLAKRCDILGDMSGIQAEVLGNNGSDLSNIPTHPADIGTDNFEQEFTLGLLESERMLLVDIEDALRRIEARTYGICLGTGQPIGLARLKARPWAKHSIEYARMLEKGQIAPHAHDTDDLDDKDAEPADQADTTDEDD